MTATLELVDELSRSIATEARHTRQPTARSLLELQIAFWSDQLQRLREHHTETLRDILRAECYVSTDLRALDSYAPARIWHYRASARDNLKTKLLHLDAERRRTKSTHENDVRDIRARLLELLVQHTLLTDGREHDHARQHHPQETRTTHR